MSDGDDFLAREAAVLGDSFVMPTGGGDSGEYDFENAASAFPDLDGDGDVPIPEPSRMKSTQGQQDGFDMDFGGYSRPAPTEVKVTGDDDLDQFDSQFPDIGGVSPCLSRVVSSNMTHEFAL